MTQSIVPVSLPKDGAGLRWTSASGRRGGGRGADLGVRFHFIIKFGKDELRQKRLLVFPVSQRDRLSFSLPEVTFYSTLKGYLEVFLMRIDGLRLMMSIVIQILKGF